MLNPFLSPSRVRLEASSSSSSLSPPVWDARSEPCSEREAVSYVQVLVGCCMKRRRYAPTQDRVANCPRISPWNLCRIPCPWGSAKRPNSMRSLSSTLVRGEAALRGP